MAETGRAEASPPKRDGLCLDERAVPLTGASRAVGGEPLEPAPREAGA